jgi:hypothetical protein
MERKAGIDPKIEQVIDQTERVVDAWNEMFAEISTRTSGEWWKIDGVGSCVHPFSNVDVLEGVAKDEILRKMEQRNRPNNAPRIDQGYSCPYHRADSGCVLGGLKPAKCVAHIDNKEEVRGKFGLDYFDFATSVYSILRRIQFSRVDDKALVNPQDNEEFVAQVIREIGSMTEGIKNTNLDKQCEIKDFAGLPEYA